MADTPTVVSVDEMREYLRIDGTANDTILTALLDAAGVYIAQATGATTTTQAANPLAKAATKMLVAEWYDPQGIDATASDRAVAETLKHIQPTEAQDNG